MVTCRSRSVQLCRSRVARCNEFRHTGRAMILVDPISGRVPEARWSPSPHCDARPPGVTPDLIVVHSISLPPGRFGGPFVDQLFRGVIDVADDPSFASLQGLRVSAHLLLRRNGALVQFVSLNERAWHAGPSRFGEREQCNDFSIGIELEGSDGTPFRALQYVRLADVCRGLREAYPALATNPVVGHNHIAPGRKTDPGPLFDWPGFRARLVPWAESAGVAQ